MEIRVMYLTNESKVIETLVSFLPDELISFTVDGTNFVFNLPLSARKGVYQTGLSYRVKLELRQSTTLRNCCIIYDRPDLPVNTSEREWLEFIDEFPWIADLVDCTSSIVTA
jgi:hypothetical protein